MRKRLPFAAFALWLLTTTAHTQSSPGWSFKTVPTAGQWNTAFANKQDFLGAAPCLTTACNAAAFVATGLPPTITGTCLVASQVGANTAGVFTANGSCTGTGGTYILSFAVAAPNGWSCDARDRTTPANTVNQTASSVSSATFLAATNNADVVQFKCTGY